MGECRLSGACAEEPRPKSLTTRSSPDQRRRPHRSTGCGLLVRKPQCLWLHDGVVTEPVERPSVVLVMFEWSVEYPLWDRSPGGFGSVDPEALGVSPDLARRLRAWNDEHNDAPNGRLSRVP